MRDIFLLDCSSRVYFTSFELHFDHEVGIDYRYQWQFTELRNIEQKILGAHLKFCDCVTT